VRTDHHLSRRRPPGARPPHEPYRRRLYAAQARAEEAEELALIYQGALRVVFHRLLGTMAEDWVAPNPQSSARCHCAQYDGVLCEFIMQVLAP